MGITPKSFCHLLSASESVLGRQSAPAWWHNPASEVSPKGVRESAFQKRMETVSSNDKTVEGEEEAAAADKYEKGNTGTQNL